MGVCRLFVVFLFLERVECLDCLLKIWDIYVLIWWFVLFYGVFVWFWIWLFLGFLVELCDYCFVYFGRSLWSSGCYRVGGFFVIVWGIGWFVVLGGLL